MVSEAWVVEKATGWTSLEREALLAAASGNRSQAAPSLGVPVAGTEVDDIPSTITSEAAASDSPVSCGSAASMA
jgi:hypothetical protein